MKKLLLLSFNILISIICFSQIEERRCELERLELQLGTINGLLKTLYHVNPYESDEDTKLSEAFESYRDSLQASFYLILEQICHIDTAMEYEFPHIDGHIAIIKSSDNKMRIFSRDAYTGSVLPQLCSYVQYLSDDSAQFEYMPDIGDDNKTISAFDASSYSSYYDMIYTISYNNKTYYLLAGEDKYLSHIIGCDLRAVSIDNHGIRNEPIFETDSGIRNHLHASYLFDNEYDYGQRMYIGNYSFPRIVFDAEEEIVLLPETYTDEWSHKQLTGRIIIYKWSNGIFIEDNIMEAKKGY